MAYNCLRSLVMFESDSIPAKERVASKDSATKNKYVVIIYRLPGKMGT